MSNAPSTKSCKRTYSRWTGSWRQNMTTCQVRRPPTYAPTHTHTHTHARAHTQPQTSGPHLRYPSTHEPGANHAARRRQRRRFSSAGSPVGRPRGAVGAGTAGTSIHCGVGVSHGASLNRWSDTPCSGASPLSHTRGCTYRQTLKRPQPHEGSPHEAEGDTTRRKTSGRAVCV